jgi:uncharacterized protein YjeT (DUF2065 family)
MKDFLVALGLVLVIEGLTFAAFPGALRRAMAKLMEAPEAHLRTAGFVATVLGLIVVWMARG